MMWLLVGFCALISLFWSGALIAAVRRRTEQRFRVTVEDAPGEAEQDSSVAIVVPARNEERNIRGCVESILTQDHPRTKLTVLDDGSEDGTRQILGELEREHSDKMSVIDGGGDGPPRGWFGKPWACKRAADAAGSSTVTPDWLLFVDADVRLEPHAVSAAVGYAEREGVDMLSGFGRLEMVSFWERVMQPVVAGMIISGNPLSRVNDPEQRRGPPIANGQFILIRSSAYEGIGGHEAVRDNVLDDVGMATAVTDAGFGYHMTFMTSLFSCRMYAGLRELWEGWTKNLYPGLGWNMGALVGLLTFTFITSLLPYLAVVGAMWLPSAVGLWGLVTVVLIQSLRMYLDHVFQQDWRYGITHGPATALLCVLLVWSAVQTRSGQATWKGRRLMAADDSGQASEDGSDST